MRSAECTHRHTYIDLSALIFSLSLSLDLPHTCTHFLLHPAPPHPPLAPADHTAVPIDHRLQLLLGLLSKGSRWPIGLHFSKCQYIYLDHCAQNTHTETLTHPLFLYNLPPRSQTFKVVLANHSQSFFLMSFFFFLLLWTLATFCLFLLDECFVDLQGILRSNATFLVKVCRALELFTLCYEYKC